MSGLTSADFDAFFGKLYQDGEQRPLEPFPWQRRLVRRILGEEPGPSGWPRALALPTASGKTATIDIAIFTLACQAELPPPQRSAPRRIFFVVDRRVIVDEAFQRAYRLAEGLHQAKDGVLRAVADRLRALAGAGADQMPLEICELRGGIYRDDAWARSPVQPTVVASTVDQVGSRLLYRGYGVSRRSWPIHAGLAAHDALILLDEAHCAQPFDETVAAVERYRGWAEDPLPSPFSFTSMTATPRPGMAEEDIFRLHEEDRAHPELSRRLRASKPAILVPAIPGKTGSKRLVEALCEKATAFSGQGARRIAVLVNRVETARRVHERLRSRLAAGAEKTLLMTGRMRPWDRDRLLETWRPRLAAGPGRRETEGPILVAATQCLEVGADMDFDAMVCEAASLDALRQRFGRLNRLGSDPLALGAIVAAADDVKAGAEDFVYGEGLRETWSWLTTRAEPHEAGVALDFGIDALDAAWSEAGRKDADLPRRLLPPAPSAPVMLPAHLDAWVQTDPAPAAEPDPALFLHGADPGRPEVQVCWRRDLELPREEPFDRDSLETTWRDTVALLPPTSAECMPVPLRVLRRWLQGVSRPGQNLTDVEGAREQPDEDGQESGQVPEHRMVLRWRGPEESAVADFQSVDHLRPGDTVVIPASLEGWYDFGHIPADSSGRLPVDIAEATHLKRHFRAVLRLHPALLVHWPEGSVDAELERTAEADGLSMEPPEVKEIASRWLEEKRDEGVVPGELAEVVAQLVEDGLEEALVLPHPSGRGWVLRGPRRAPAAAGLELSPLVAETFSSDDDSASATTRVTLEEHCRGVAELSASFAAGCGLSPEQIADLRLAGLLHDLGKADSRFQAWLYGGNRLAAQLGPDLAKSQSLPESLRERERARRRAGYPKGGRHELLSVRLVESAPSVLQAAADPDLVLHLLATHHGSCRPLAPEVTDDEPVLATVEHDGLRLAASSATGLERIDSGLAERFWRLVRRYGWWGLAFFEALFRLADHRRSEAELREASASRQATRRHSA